MTDHSQRIQDIKIRAEKAALHPPSLLEQVYHDRAWLLSQLDASLSRERALREALNTLLPYAEWQIKEGPGHHPTLPSAIAKARATLQGKD